MAGNIFGNHFKVLTWGESHGGFVGAVVDGCPPGINILTSDLQKDLYRRSPGRSPLSSPRKETDNPQILSGVFDGKTLGTPICVIVRNENPKSSEYYKLKDVYRPSHADYTYDAKYGVRDWRGGGRASGRETVGRVIAGSIATQVLTQAYGTKICAYVRQIADVQITQIYGYVDRNQIDKSEVRCPDPKISRRMIDQIEMAKEQGDSVGGVVELVVKKVPVGLGEPVFHKIDADLASAMLSIPAVKGFEIGSGFRGSAKSGSDQNDLFHVLDGKVRTRTNNSGGIQGGITNGEDIVARIAFKPCSSIAKEQDTVNRNLDLVKIHINGRHDPCIVPRAVPIVEAMAAIVLLDHYLMNVVTQKFRPVRVVRE